MPMRSRTRRGGNRAQKPMAWGKPQIKKPTKALNPHAHLDGRECPTCHSIVGVRQDGKLRNHRVGQNRRNSWPCPGEEVYA